MAQHADTMTATREKQSMDADVKREQIAASSKPAAEIKLDANEAVKGMAPAMSKHMDAMGEHMNANVQAMAAAGQAMAQAAAALERVAEVMAADSEIVRDRSGRAVRSRKVLNRPRPTVQ